MTKHGGRKSEYGELTSEEYQDLMLPVYSKNSVEVFRANLGEKSRWSISDGADAQEFQYDRQYLDRIGFSYERLRHFTDSMEAGEEKATMQLVYEMAFKEGFERLRKACWDGYGRKIKNIGIDKK